MKVLSLFDGISCGMIALERAGLPVERYVSYEIEPFAIKISRYHYPQIEQRGDVTKADFSEFKDFDLVIGGFPCQDLSISNTNRKGLDGRRSGLFWELVRALEVIKPKYFLVENNFKMPKEDERIVTETLGVKPICINSAVLSAQSRVRLYWTNIPIGELVPLNPSLCVRDILVPDVGKPFKNCFDKTVFCECPKTGGLNKPNKIGVVGKGGQGERVYSIDAKSVNLTANGGGIGAKTGLYLVSEDVVRRLIPLEAERLQTLPDNYTLCDGIKDTNRYRAIGNCWTVDVIAFLLSGIKGVI